MSPRLRSSSVGLAFVYGATQDPHLTIEIGL